MRLRDGVGLAFAILLMNAPPVFGGEIERMWVADLAGSERLGLLAYGEALSTGQMPRPGLARMRQEMTRQGYYFAGGPPSRVAGNIQVGPLLAWEGNINGGVLQDRFAIGGLIFQADPEFRAKSGLIAGISAGGLLRYAWAEGRLVEMRGAAELGWSPEHEISRTDLMLSICSRNHLAGWNFLDLCAIRRYHGRELGNASTDQASAEISRIVSAPNSIHEVSLRYAWESTADKNERQVGVSIESIWDRAVTEIAVAIGDPFSDAGFLRDRIDASVAWFAHDRSWSLDVWMQRSEGDMFLGVPRKDRLRGIGIATDLRPGTSLRLGYLDSSSTAGIANYDYVTLDLRFGYLRW